MSESGISKPLEKFIRENIKSLEHLEVLLVIASEVGKQWSAREVYESVKSSPGSVEERLAELTARGLLVKSGSGLACYQISSQPHSLLETTRELSRAYRERRLKVIEIVYSGVSAVEEFAKAFKLKEET